MPGVAMMSFQLYCTGDLSAGADAAYCYGRWNVYPMKGAGEYQWNFFPSSCWYAVMAIMWN